LEYPKSHSLMSGRAVLTSSVFSSFTSRLATPWPAPDMRESAGRRAPGSKGAQRLAWEWVRDKQHNRNLPPALKMGAIYNEGLCRPRTSPARLRAERAQPHRRAPAPRSAADRLQLTQRAPGRAILWQ